LPSPQIGGDGRMCIRFAPSAVNFTTITAGYNGEIRTIPYKVRINKEQGITDYWSKPRITCKICVMEYDFVYLVQGSSSEPYIIRVLLSPLQISCNCTAADNGLPCKHRISILKGENPGIVTGDMSKLAVIAKAAKETNVFELLEQYEAAKKTLKAVIVLLPQKYQPK
jgi:hypothetical protein